MAVMISGGGGGASKETRAIEGKRKAASKDKQAQIDLSLKELNEKIDNILAGVVEEEPIPTPVFALEPPPTTWTAKIKSWFKF